MVVILLVVVVGLVVAMKVMVFGSECDRVNGYDDSGGGTEGGSGVTHLI